MDHEFILKENQRSIGDRKIAYFSFEIGIRSDIHTYSGGLGILAGDTIRSCADLHVPMVAVTMLYKKGYFYQELDNNGEQRELPDTWNPEEYLTLLPEKVTVPLEGRKVLVQAWLYDVTGINGYKVPVLFLDTDIEGNTGYDRSLVNYLYGGDQRYRLAQEIILGRAGVAMLNALGFNRINRYHMNEGHASILTLELLHRQLEEKGSWDIAGVKKLCVFTTHTPVPAGHDKFPYDLVMRMMGEILPLDLIKRLGGQDRLNMTLLALNLSHYKNGVAQRHGAISQEMFPGYQIDAITNGIHSSTWVNSHFTRLFETYIPGWTHDPFSLRYAYSIPKSQIWNAHKASKKELIDYINRTTRARFDYDTLTVGFARRATAYKRANLVFYDLQRLTDIARNKGNIQFVFSGKAHPNDQEGQAMIQRIATTAKQVNEHVRIVYLENYDIMLAKLITSSVDLWLNTPQKPKEASGTSGMKAAHNGIPSFSILDGWWIEGCIEGLTGWAIGTAAEEMSNDERDAGSFYEKLDRIILPVFYSEREKWIEIMRNSIAINASFFNTHRMVLQYVLNAYFS